MTTINGADQIMKGMISEILDYGTSTENQKVRPVWTDTNEPAYTKKVFGIVNTYDISAEFPAGTLRPVPFKNCIKELLWIWQKKSNKIEDLGLHIWDQWEGADGTIGKAYGYQVGKKSQTIYIKDGKELTGINPEYFDAARRENILDDRIKEIKCDWKNVYPIPVKVDQTDYILHELKHNPFSRRIIANMYNIDELDEMNLHPCAYSITLNVTEENGEKVLNMILNQRSLDVIVAGYWNVCQYAVLLALFAHCSNMKPGMLMHVIADAHIYDRHFDIAKELISRESYPAPTLWINPEKRDFYDITIDDIKLLDYQHNEQIKNIPVAK